MVGVVGAAQGWAPRVLQAVVGGVALEVFPERVNYGGAADLACEGAFASEKSMAQDKTHRQLSKK